MRKYVHFAIPVDHMMPVLNASLSSLELQPSTYYSTIGELGSEGRIFIDESGKTLQAWYKVSSKDSVPNAREAL